MSMEWQTEDGRTIVAIPYRRESSAEEIADLLIERNRESNTDDLKQNTSQEDFSIGETTTTRGDSADHSPRR